MKKTLTVLLIFVVLYACTDTTNPEIIPIDTTVTANLSGEILFTNDTAAVNNNITNRIWSLNENSKLEIKVSKNLTSNPYNLKLTISVDENNPEAPKLSFISDFDRKIVPGDRYRLITTIILEGNTSFIPGNTGGQITYNNTLSPYGFGFGSELEINLAETGGTIINDSAQYIILSGTFVFDNNNNSGVEMGTFNIIIDGNNIIDTSVF